MLKKNGEYCPELNVVVLADDDTLLWDTRNMFFQIREQKNYILHVTLTKYFSTLQALSKFIPGGVDLIYFTLPVPNRIISELQRIANVQEATGLAIYETDGMLFEFYQNGTCFLHRRIPVKEKLELFRQVELICDFLACQKTI